MPTTNDSKNYRSTNSSSTSSTTPIDTTPPCTLAMFESALNNGFNRTPVLNLVRSPGFQKYELLTANANRDNVVHLLFASNAYRFPESAAGQEIIDKLFSHPQIRAALLARNAQSYRPYQLVAAQSKINVGLFMKLSPKDASEIVLDFSNQRGDEITTFVERVFLPLVEQGRLTWKSIAKTIAEWISQDSYRRTSGTASGFTHQHYAAILPYVGELQFGDYNLNTRACLVYLVKFYQEMLAAMPDDLRSRTLQQWVDNPAMSSAEKDILQYCLREDFYQRSKHKFSMLLKKELVAYLIENQLTAELKVVLTNEPELTFCADIVRPHPSVLNFTGIIPIIADNIDIGDQEILTLLTAHPRFAITSADIATLIENERIRLLLYFVYAGATLDENAYHSIATAVATFPDLRKLQRPESVIINSVCIDLHNALEQHAIPAALRTTLNSQLHTYKKEAIEKRNISVFLNALVSNLTKLLHDKPDQLHSILNDINFELIKKGMKLPTAASAAASLDAAKPDAVLGISMFNREAAQTGEPTSTAAYDRRGLKSSG